MRAVLFDAPGDPSVLRLGEAPMPDPGPGEVRLRVRATALNRADVAQRLGRYPAPPGTSDILGLEAAGTVDAVGEGVASLRVGDRAMALLAGGGYAEYAVVRADHTMPIPNGMSFEDAAAIPEAFLTAAQVLFQIGGLRPGGVALVHAGASGVGTAAVQLARWQGARVFATASAGKHALLHDLGVTRAIDYRTEDFADVVTTETDGADVILDPIGASYAAQNLRSVALDGRWVVLATMGGAVVEGLDLRRMMARRASLVATTLRNRPDAYKAALVQRFAADCLASFVAPGGHGGAPVRLRPVIDSVIGWADVADAHRRMEANETAGKIVLRIP